MDNHKFFAKRKLIAAFRNTKHITNWPERSKIIRKIMKNKKIQFNDEEYE